MADELAPPALRERRHRLLPRRLIPVRGAAYVAFTGPRAFGDAVFAHSADPANRAPQGLSGSGGCLNLRPGAACFKAGRKSRNDEDDKFSLPTGSSLIEDIFKVAPRGFITDVEFDCGRLKFVSRD
jgi:hypothetical protein